MTTDWHARVISRLRSYGYIPERTPAQLLVTYGGLKEGQWRWRLADSQGSYLGVGSRYGVRYLAHRTDWMFAEEPEGLHVQPGGS